MGHGRPGLQKDMAHGSLPDVCQDIEGQDKEQYLHNEADLHAIVVLRVSS